MIKGKKFQAQSARKTGQIMGINVISTSSGQVLAGVEDFISYNHRFFIATPNPELILLSQKNAELRKAMNSADFPVPDGVGLKIANFSLSIIKGRSLALSLLKLANKKGWKVFLLGGLDNEAAEAAKQLKIENSKLKIETDAGPILNIRAEASGNNKELENRVIEKINNFAPQLLFVAFGNPKQEIWIYKNLSKLKIGGAMAVGGTLRYIAGLAAVPPKWMSETGLEWLWRLLTEPKRIGRIFNAVVVFPFRLFWYRVSN
jgi:N-acetylglucosaminyldiphosphoundecaprenol N-acetyl-beta-D-mannosaminyltransferase